MKKFRTLKQLEDHPAVSGVTRNYDGRGSNLVELKPGFTCWDSGSIIGSAEQILSDIQFIQKEGDPSPDPGDGLVSMGSLHYHTMKEAEEAKIRHEQDGDRCEIHPRKVLNDRRIFTLKIFRTFIPKGGGS